MQSGTEELYDPALREFGFVAEPNNHRYGPNGLCWRHPGGQSFQPVRRVLPVGLLLWSAGSLAVLFGIISVWASWMPPMKRYFLVKSSAADVPRLRLEIHGLLQPGQDGLEPHVQGAQPDQQLLL